ncbi:MAG: PadR family transcriptional regulator [Spirochaetes bacterium]|nr:PadR family transcriptional regulator [Spirochaetota bacterium]
MPKSNKTKYAILGLLASGPRSGYDIKKTVDHSIGFFWNENYGHLYPILNRMERGGLLSMTQSGRASGPVKKVYAITARGKKELLAWLRTPVDDQPIRNELLLRIFFGRRAGAGDVKNMVRAEKKKNQELVSIFNEIKSGIERGNSSDAPYWAITLDFGIRKSEMIIQWCDETLKALGRMK